MNTNEETMAMMPNETEQNVNNVNPSGMPEDTAPMQEKKGMKTSEKVAAGAAGMAAAAAVGTGAAYAYNHMPHNTDEAEAVANAAVETTDYLLADNGAPSAEPVHVVREHVVETHHETVYVPVNNAMPVPKSSEPQEPSNGGDEEDIYDVHFVGMTVAVDDDGDPVIAGTMTINGVEMVVYDVNFNGTFDVATIDVNHNGSIDEDEIFDISDAEISIDDFYAELKNENPEEAAKFWAQMNDLKDKYMNDGSLASTDANDSTDNDYIKVADDTEDSNDVDPGFVNVVATDNDDIDDNFINVALDGDTDDANPSFVNVTTAGDNNLQEGFVNIVENVDEDVELAQIDEPMVAQVDNEPEFETEQVDSWPADQVDSWPADQDALMAQNDFETDTFDANDSLS